MRGSIRITMLVNHKLRMTGRIAERHQGVILRGRCQEALAVEGKGVV